VLHISQLFSESDNVAAETELADTLRTALHECGLEISALEVQPRSQNSSSSSAERQQFIARVAFADCYAASAAACVLRALPSKPKVTVGRLTTSTVGVLYDLGAACCIAVLTSLLRCILCSQAS
jgi:hypothetical protein